VNTIFLKPNVFLKSDGSVRGAGACRLQMT
jgi:hypothetical protein